MTTSLWIAVALAGAAGACGRVIVDYLVTRRAQTRRSTRAPWPLGTAVVNLSGSLLLGLVVGVSADGLLSSASATVLGPAFVGSYTTFSTWMVQTVELIVERRHTTALLGLSTIVAGVILGGAGFALGRALVT